MRSLCELLQCSDQWDQMAPLDTIEVHYWTSGWWGDGHTNALIHICRKFRVRKLRFTLGIVKKVSENTFLGMLSKHAGPRTNYGLPTLRKVVIECGTSFIPHYVWMFTAAGNLAHFELKPQIYSGPSAEESQINYFAFQLSNRISWNTIFSIRRINIDAPSANIEVDKSESHRDSLVRMFLKRNQRAHRKCQQAIIAFLNLRRRRAINQDRNVVALIANMVWDTRGTKVWAE